MLLIFPLLLSFGFLSCRRPLCKDIQSGWSRMKQISRTSAASDHQQDATTAADYGVKDAVIVLDPVTEWREVLQAMKEKDMVAIAATCNPLSGRDDIAKFIPDDALLKKAGFDFVLTTQMEQNGASSSPSPTFTGFDVYSAAQQIKLLEKEENIAVRGVVPLAETAVEYCDTISALLGIISHNPLNTVLARRDKALMKEAVSSAGLRVAKFARIKKSSALPDIVSNLAMDYPLVVKTPAGFSTTDVYICYEESEAIEKANVILNSGAGPDCRRPMFALVEEYIVGDEMAVNIIASPGLDGDGLVCTDAWLYRKTIDEGSARYNEAEMMDPNDGKLKTIISYAKQVAKAVGIGYGAGHIELKAEYCSKTKKYKYPCMIEVGARLSGGRKATLTKAVLDGWNPFQALIDSHCGRKVHIPPTFSPKRHARHLFLPHLHSGRITEIEGEDRLLQLETYHSHFLLAQVGDIVERTTDITSCSGFVWLVGQRAAVESDAESVLRMFVVHTQPNNDGTAQADFENESSNTRSSESSTRLDCMGEVIPGLWVGDLSSLSSIDTIPSHGTSIGRRSESEITVVTLLSSSGLANFARDCVGLKADEQKSKGITIRQDVVDMKDNCDPGFLSGPLPLAIDAIDDALCSSSNSNKLCLLHCAKGESRSVAVAVAWLMLRKGFTLHDALAKVRQTRPTANPNLGFIAALHAIEACNGDLHKASARISANK